MDADADKEGSDERETVLSILTAEHAALQSARLRIAFSRNDRLAEFLSAVSAVVVALAFIGQVSKFGTPFYVFALTLLPTLAVLGVFTFLRLLQLRIEESYTALAVNRIRHYYVEKVPLVRRHLLMPHHDSMDTLPGVGVHSSLLTPMLMIPGTVAFVDSVLVGTALGLVAHLVFATSTIVSAGIAVACAALSLAMHHFYQRRRWQATHASYEPEFPATRHDQDHPSKNSHAPRKQ